MCAQSRVNRYGFGMIALGLLGLLRPAADPIRFAPHADHPTGSGAGPGPGARTTAAGDVDGDDDIDVVTTDWFGEGPIVMRNRGDGTFDAPVAITGAPDVGAIASGDLDADGDLDLVGRTGDAVVVMLGDGHGAFDTAGTVALTQNAQATVILLDADGDDDLDVVTPSPAGIRTLLGRGDGTFELGPETPLLGLLSDLAPADFDRDQHPDIAVVDATPALQRVVALTGNGDGSFTVTGDGSVGEGPEGVMAGDLDGDGDDDVVSVDSFSMFSAIDHFTVAVLLSDGNGGFEPATEYPIAAGPVSGILADLNADGRLDVAVSGVGAGHVTVYAGNGEGGLVDRQDLRVADTPQTPASADLDGDGDLDLAVPAPQVLSVLLNLGPPTDSPVPDDDDTSSDDDVLPATGSATSPMAGLVVALALALSRTRRGRPSRAPRRCPRADPRP